MAVLEAALALLAERGAAGMSVDALAQQAGVSKATIYRHWPSKDAVCREAVAGLAPGCVPDPSHPAAEGALIARAAALARTLSTTRGGRPIAAIAAGAGSDEALRRAWEQAVVTPHRRALREVLVVAVADGSARGDLDVDVATAAVVAPPLERAARGHLRGLRPFARRVAETVWVGVAAR